MRRFRLAASILIATLLVSRNAEAFSVSFRWCGASPEFQLRDVPKGTATLDFHMQDLMVPTYPHGGGKVPYRGEASIPCGTLQGSYRGPSPPPPQIHTYRWTVKALDASGKPLATAASEQKFPQ
ncbi:MAG: phospholipid-binding protein [Hyphomicrobiales bacterium]|nr:phospholipid-binding protein [Hyphomicrobiales bacterium]